MSRVGRHLLLRRLGVGSFATVWSASGPEGEVAVKVLAENWAVDEDVRARFLAEARLLQRIEDPRVVGVHEIGTLPDGRPWFAMDLCPGGSLDDLRRQRVPPERALRLTAEAARSLQVLHEHGVVHRDVTPGNLLLEADGRVRLADLGVAKDLSVGTGSTMTAGTPAYMAWEQATGGPLDRRCDVYSLACVGYALLTGRPPFPVRTLADLVARGPDARPPAVAAAVGLPAELDEVLAAALSSDPRRRPPTAAALADALDAVAALPQRPEPRPQRPEPRPQRPEPVEGPRREGSGSPDFDELSPLESGQRESSPQRPKPGPQRPEPGPQRPEPGPQRPEPVEGRTRWRPGRLGVALAVVVLVLLVVLVVSVGVLLT